MGRRSRLVISFLVLILMEFVRPNSRVQVTVPVPFQLTSFVLGIVFWAASVAFYIFAVAALFFWAFTDINPRRLLSRQALRRLEAVFVVYAAADSLLNWLYQLIQNVGHGGLLGNGMLPGWYSWVMVLFSFLFATLHVMVLFMIVRLPLRPIGLPLELPVRLALIVWAGYCVAFAAHVVISYFYVSRLTSLKLSDIPQGQAVFYGLVMNIKLGQAFSFFFTAFQKALMDSVLFTLFQFCLRPVSRRDKE